MKYDYATLEALVGQLRGYKKELEGEATNLNTSSGKLHQVWEDQDGWHAFQQAKDGFDKEFGTDQGADNGTTIDMVERLAVAVENAIAAAKRADGQVAGSFA